MSDKRHDDAFVALQMRVALNRRSNVAEVMEMAQGEDFTFVDVREDREFAVDFCADAVHIGKGVLERDIGKHVEDLGARIILYCGGGYRSAIAAESLQRMGFMNVASMDGGIRAWRAADGAIVTQGQ